jgi:hypothetical protein
VKQDAIDGKHVLPLVILFDIFFSKEAVGNGRGWGDRCACQQDSEF